MIIVKQGLLHPSFSTRVLFADPHVPRHGL